MKNILLVAPIFMELYKDIIAGLKMAGYNVYFFEDRKLQHDTRYKKELSEIDKCRIEHELAQYWEYNFSTVKNIVDSVLVINGFSVCPYFFERIRALYPNAKRVYYIWDKIYQNAKFEQHFNGFDEVYCFDPEDAEIFHIKLLHNFWIPVKPLNQRYKVFGFGSYKPDRFQVFRHVDEVCNQKELSHYIKIYVPEIRQTLSRRIKNLILTLTNSNSESSPRIYNSDLTVHKVLSPDSFRQLLAESETIIDTHYNIQKGMTPRFMWALGLGKKIITTNENIRQLEFYNPDYVYVLNHDNRRLVDFINSANVKELSKEEKDIISKYRIDNWLNILLN